MPDDTTPRLDRLETTVEAHTAQLSKLDTTTALVAQRLGDMRSTMSTNAAEIKDSIEASRIAQREDAVAERAAKAQWWGGFWKFAMAIAGLAAGLSGAGWYGVSQSTPTAQAAPVHVPHIEVIP